jgi:hypothetical protein
MALQKMISKSITNYPGCQYEKTIINSGDFKDFNNLKGNFIIAVFAEEEFEYLKGLSNILLFGSPFRGLGFQFILKHFLKLFQLGAYYKLAVTLAGIIVVIILMIRFCRIKNGHGF